MDCDSMTQYQGTCEGRGKNSNDERLHLLRSITYQILCMEYPALKKTPLKWVLYSYFIEEETEVQSSVAQVQRASKWWCQDSRVTSTLRDSSWSPRVRLPTRFSRRDKSCSLRMSWGPFGRWTVTKSKAGLMDSFQEPKINILFSF